VRWTAPGALTGGAWARGRATDGRRIAAVIDERRIPGRAWLALNRRRQLTANGAGTGVGHVRRGRRRKKTNAPASGVVGE
jgi:hypothetical protein